jgi:hypothetical protein
VIRLAKIRDRRVDGGLTGAGSRPDTSSADPSSTKDGDHLRAAEAKARFSPGAATDAHGRREAGS